MRTICFIFICLSSIRGCYSMLKTCTTDCSDRNPILGPSGCLPVFAAGPWPGIASCDPVWRDTEWEHFLINCSISFLTSWPVWPRTRNRRQPAGWWGQAAWRNWCDPPPALRSSILICWKRSCAGFWSFQETLIGWSH